MNASEKKLVTDGGYLHEDGEYRFCSSFRPEPRLLIPALVMIPLITWWGVNRGVDWYWIVFPSLFVFFAGACVSWQFTIEPKNSVIHERAFLFGRRLLRERLIPLSDYRFVLVETGNASGEDGIVFWVSLKHKSGRRKYVKYFHTTRPAEEFAWRLHCDTGIEIQNRLKISI